MVVAMDPKVGRYQQQSINCLPLPHRAPKRQEPSHTSSLARAAYQIAPLQPNHAGQPGTEISPLAHPYYSTSTATTRPQFHPLAAIQTEDDALDTGLTEDASDDLNSPPSTSPHDDAFFTGSGPKGADAKRPRACDSCRGLKVKCIIDSVSKEPCKRCAKARRPCIVTPPTRKRQKKSDSKVAELERKIDALTASLAQRDGQSSTNSPGRAAKRDINVLESSADHASCADGSHKRPCLIKVVHSKHEAVMAGNARHSSSQSAPTLGSIYDQQIPRVYDHSDIHVKLDGIISPEDANRLFDRYISGIVPHFPAVPFAPGTTAAQVRRSNPILFLAILSGTSYGADIHPDTQTALERELRNVFAECLWKNGEKSLQLVQALQVGALWYRPPANFEQHMFYQMVHMATIMGIDIGISKKQTPWRNKSNRPAGDRKLKLKLHDPQSVESRRAWLVNYFLCVTIANILRRPILLRFNDYMRECLEILESSQDALASDKVLCQHVRLARISEEIAILFAMDDPTVNLTMSDGKVSYGIKHHKEDLKALKARNILSPPIQLSAHVTNLHLHEIALHTQGNAADFKAPFTEETFRLAVSQVVLGPSHVDALIECQNSCRNMVETFLSMDFEVILVLPVIFSPGDMSNVISADDLHLDENLSKLEASFASIINRDKLSPHTKFLFVVQRLYDTFRTIKRHSAITQDSSKTSLNSRVKPGQMTTNPLNRSHSPSGLRQAQGLYLLSEAAVNSNSPTPTHRLHATSNPASADAQVTQPSPSATRPALVSSHHVPQSHPPQNHHSDSSHPLQTWYNTSSTPNGIDFSSYEMLSYPDQFDALEPFDYSLAGLGVDGFLSELYMDNEWIKSHPASFMGWNG